jgi:D-glucosaminate-6-phosphate ammonia-lyase
MTKHFLHNLLNLKAGFNRRDFFRQGGALTIASAAIPSLAVAAPKTSEAVEHSALYESIGVRPVINARGTFTILTGSQSLPQVKDAMVQASRSYVQMDELMEV